MRNAYCMLETNAYGKMVWEMVDEEYNNCISRFSTEADAKAWAAANNVKITQWIMF